MSIQYGFIGGGNMATALIRGLIHRRVCPPAEIIVSDIQSDRLNYLKNEYGIQVSSKNMDVVIGASILLLAVKPQNLDSVSKEIGGLLQPDQTLISILAGVRYLKLRDHFQQLSGIVRVMPNLPAIIGQGISALAIDDKTTEFHLALTETLFNTVGATFRVAENLMDAVTAVSGSGPGFIFKIIDILVEAGISAGLSASDSQTLWKKTLLGAAMLLDTSTESAADLCRRVCSPGGTTQAGIDKMLSIGLESALKEGVLAARDRSIELSR